ncbi:AI-2E family transporter [Halobacteria archaeon HArc-gm2]|nr:AI-2E family transporter [Halobacteria archaeon HArc-gm2]
MVQFELDINWPRTIWIVFGLVLAGAIVFVLHSFVGTFVFGLFLYYATRRLHRRVRRRVRPASLAAGVSLTLLALPALVLLYYTAAIALEELARATDRLNDVETQAQIGPYLDVVEPYVELSTVVQDPTAVLTDAGGLGALSETLTAALGYIGIVGTGLLHLFVMCALAFYLLRDGPQLARWGTTFTDRRGVLDHYFREVDKSLDKVFYGNILNAVITGTVGAIAFSLLNLAPAPFNVPYPALTGLLAGVASLIPIVGMKLVYVPLAIYLAGLAAVNGDGWWFVGLFVAVAFAVVDVIPDLVVRPYVSGGSLHVGALMFAYILGPLLFGWYGIFLGPMLLVLVVHFVRIVLPELLTGTPIEPYSVDPTHVVDGPVDDPEPASSGSADVSPPGAAAGDGMPADDVGPTTD